MIVPSSVALTMAVAAKAQGLRVLLVEADPLDDVNLKSFLVGALGLKDTLDALVVATASHIEAVPDGWNVLKL
jgi:Mrp family chromosome partitioning ATPase